MKRDPQERAEEISAIINLIKKEHTFFTKEEFMKLITSRRCPYATSIFTILKKRGLVIRTADKTWSWSLDAPIHFKAIQPSIDKLATAHNASQTNWVEKKKRENSGKIDSLIEAIEPVIVKSVSLENAIEIIKQHGGKVFMPSVKFEEV